MNNPKIPKKARLRMKLEDADIMLEGLEGHIDCVNMLLEAAIDTNDITPVISAIALMGHIKKEAGNFRKSL